MKRFLAILLSMMLLCGGLAAFAEDASTGDSAGDMTMPEGEMPAEGDSSGDSAGDMTMPEGEIPADGTIPTDDAASSGDSAGDSSGMPGMGGDPVEGQIGSWNGGGTDASTVAGNDYAYDAALYVTAEGVDAEKSATDRITAGSYDDKAASGLVINDSEAGHNAIIVVDTEYAISDVTIDLVTDADGTETCDFSGKGSVFATYGEAAIVTVENANVHTAGVATMPLFADGGSTLTVISSKLQSDGGTLYKEYLSTPDQKLMVAPPWILGIMGNSRCLNIMGVNTTVNVIDSETSSGAWAVLSTDAGTNMQLNVYNSSLTLNNGDESLIPLQAEGGQISETLDNPFTENYGSGYGSFVIGSAVESFYGATFRVGTYATIFNGGKATYTALEAGKTYDVKNAAGETISTYEAKETVVTDIHSDTFAFMAMQNANSITIDKGTKVDSNWATFLIKTGYGGQATTATIDDATITNGGILIQVIDNDDATNGGMMAATDEANTNGGAQNFKPYHQEAAGFNTAPAGVDSSVQTFTFTNGAYTGNIYNGSGSENLDGSALYVTFGAGAQYTGAAASTSTIHVTYEGAVKVKENGCNAFEDAETAAAFAEQYQNTYFTINEYWSIGQVVNMVNSNGANAIHITLTDDASWQVTGTSLITTLTLEGNSQVVVPAGVTLTVGETVYTDCVLTADAI